MKVLFTIPNFKTAGSGFALLQLALGLQQRGVNIAIMAKSDGGVLTEKIKQKGIPLYIHKYEAPRVPLINFISTILRTSMLFKSINPDVIYSYHYSSDYSEAVASRLAKIPWIYVKKNMSWYGPSQNSWIIRSYLAKKINVQNTEMEREFLSKWSGKLVKIPIGVDTTKYSPGGSNENDLIRFIHVSSLLPVKGIEVLLRAYAHLCDEVSFGHELVIVGPDTDEYVKRLKATYSEIPSLTFVGVQQDVLPFLKESDCFIQSSLNEGRREGAPIALQEAMSVGLVCIGSRVAGINDQLKDFGYLQYDSRDFLALKDLMIQVLKMNNNERLEIGSAMRSFIESNFSLENEVKMTFDLIREMITS